MGLFELLGAVSLDVFGLESFESPKASDLNTTRFASTLGQFQIYHLIYHPMEGILKSSLP